MVPLSGGKGERFNADDVGMSSVLAEAAVEETVPPIVSSCELP